MSHSKRSSVQKYHDRVARTYDHSYDDAFWQWHDALTWDYLKPHLPRDLGKEVVDLGCGTGKWGAKLAKSGYRVTCVDISAKMLDQARLKFEEQGSLRRAEFVQADLADLSVFAPGRFALAIAFGEPIGCTPDIGATLRQVRRIIADGGCLVATLDNRLAAIDFYLERGDPDELAQFVRKGATHWLTKDSGEQFPINTVAPHHLASMVESAGFTMIEMLGKTVLPMRHHRERLVDSQARRQWSAVEKSLARDPFAIGRAPHIQFVAKAVAPSS